MFGYVTADWTRLDEAQSLRYQSCYCGLCHALRRDFSPLCRLALNYDITFLVLLLSSLFEPEEDARKTRCAAHPFQPRPIVQNVWTAYGAAMTVLLSYEKCRDDWHDDRNPLRLAESGLFRRAARGAAERYPRQAGAVAKGLQALSAIEARGTPEPDAAANCFAGLLGELFVPDGAGRWAPELRTLGEALGRFVYLADAAADLQDDLRRGRYNPLTALAPGGKLPAAFRSDLAVVLGEGTAAFERLPLVQDAALLRNILYSGVFLQYDRAMDKRGGRAAAKTAPFGTRPKEGDRNDPRSL